MHEFGGKAFRLLSFISSLTSYFVLAPVVSKSGFVGGCWDALSVKMCVYEIRGAPLFQTEPRSTEQRGRKQNRDCSENMCLCCFLSFKLTNQQGCKVNTIIWVITASIGRQGKAPLIVA